MIKVEFAGRTGNILLQNIGASILSKKFDLKVLDYCDEQRFDILGLNLYKGGTRIINPIIDVFDRKHNENTSIEPYGTIVDLMRRTEDIYHGIRYVDMFQVKDFVKNYREDILNHFNLKYDDNFTKSIFIHVRLGDVTNLNPGIEYYEKCIRKIENFENIYFSSDNFNHPICQRLKRDFGAKEYSDGPVETINFAKNFGHIILSKGTFSWWIGILSRANEIFFPFETNAWHGDIFVFDEWKMIKK